MENIIEFNNVYKVYKLYKSDKDRFLGLFIKRKDVVKKIATNYLTFNIKKGEKVALLGPNGAGKSTVLKMITDVCFPDEGSIKVKGKVGALLELSAGFDMEFTGRENIYLKCTLLGLSKKEIKKIEDDIIEFADIKEYIDQPVRMYSSGMKARLGFSIIVNSNIDILIIDEALAVGDNSFKNKCLNKVKELSNKKDITMIFVTHSLSLAKEFCDRGIILNKGHLVYDDKIDEVINEYNRLF
jgi:teichoic acid transport system ATP-binding protein